MKQPHHKIGSDRLLRALTPDLFTFSRKLAEFSIFRINSANPNISRKCFNPSEFKKKIGSGV